jgi:hypothetical protein
MEWMEFIKPDRKVLIIFLVLLAISYYNTTTYPGIATEKLKPTLKCPIPSMEGINLGEFNKLSYNYYGHGWPFMCFNVSLVESCCKDNGECVGIGVSNSKELISPAPYEGVFVPENFILDVIILYLMTLLVVRIYDRYFNRENKQ